MPASSKKRNAPVITIAIPTMNNSSTIGAVLKSIYAQDYPRQNIQVVFVDGLSKDGTYKKITAWTKKNRHYYSDISVSAEKSNIPKARNLCLNRAKGKFVLFWDADVVATATSIKSLLNHFKDPTVGIANIPYFLEKPRLIDKVLKFDEPTKVSFVKAVVMGFTMLRRQLARKVGNFNERLEGFEDQEYCRRVAKAKFKIVYDPSVRLVHLKKGIGLRRFVRDNFSRRSKYVNTLVGTGSRVHALKAIYYVMLPLNFVAGAILAEFLNWNIGICILKIALIYMLLSIIWHLREARKSYYGLLSPIVHLVGGISLAYGMLWQAVKEK